MSQRSENFVAAVAKSTSINDDLKTALAEVNRLRALLLQQSTPGPDEVAAFKALSDESDKAKATLQVIISDLKSLK